MTDRAWTSRPVVAGVTAFFTACAGQPVRPAPVAPARQSPVYQPAPMVSVQTPGVVIEDESGSFSLQAAPAPAPFDVGADCVLHPTTQHAGAGELHGGKRVKVKLPPDLASAAGGQASVYGVLALCGVPPGATGAASRHYALQVPSGRLEQTSDGRVSLVYEPFAGDESGERGMAWMLWLSRVPFPPPTAAGSVETPLSRSNAEFDRAQRQYEADLHGRDYEQQAAAQGPGAGTWLAITGGILLLGGLLSALVLSLAL